MSWQLPLVIAAVLFAGFTIWRIRPALRVNRGARRRRAGALRDAKKRVEAAKTSEDAERALALCDAGDACAASFRATSAIGYYLRAMRRDPASSALVQRAAVGPRAPPARARVPSLAQARRRAVGGGVARCGHHCAARARRPLRGASPQPGPRARVRPRARRDGRTPRFRCPPRAPRIWPGEQGEDPNTWGPSSLRSCG